ncbi:TetR/AcrR family transcriptional regulator [Nocardia carnea]|uniref:TetR/AcrR family transcriptional regulator n=1 Tax=Nocardia carnea TaxID=37328 RepID=UPI0024550BD7|nr:TetR/AcrR family transcriptional regulator [Nocardia carnea]
MTSTGIPARPRGRVDKQQAILAAAFTVFARTGYTQTRMDQIAAEAGVAKATVYSHFGDKEQVFRHAVRALSEAARQANLAVVERLAEPGTDVPATLRSVGTELVRCYCSPESRALRRLVCAEAGQFPELIEIVDEVSGQVLRALADRFARLALAGVLGLDDPDVAASQWTALLTGALPVRYQFGVEPLPEADADAVAVAAATTFLAAFGR